MSTNNDDLPEIPDPLYDVAEEVGKPRAPEPAPAPAPAQASAPSPAPAEEDSDTAVDIPDATYTSYARPRVDPHKDTFDSAVKMAFVGAGQGGGRIAQSFYNFGYRRVCMVNTTNQDLKSLKISEDRKMVIGNNRGGAGKDPDQGELAAKESYEDIMDLFMRSWGEGAEYLYVCVGGGGGSGTGSWPVLLDAMREYAKSTNIEKPFYKSLGVIMTIPKRSEGSRVQRNALTAINQALQKLEKNQISSLILVDNSKIHELYPGLPVKMFWKVANDTFTGIFHTFNLLAAQDSDYNTFDRADYRSVIKNGLMIFGRTRVPHWRGKEDISQAVRQNLKGSLLADGFDLAKADMAGAVVVAHDDVFNEIPMENIDYAFNSLGRVLGNEGITLHNGIYEGKKKGMQVFTIVSGLQPPQSRLDELDNLSK
jgi:cell division GTPase FtsZ